MKHDPIGSSTSEVPLCQYSPSRLSFRGPRRSLDRDYVVCLGGTETFGRFMELPYPQLIERALRVTSVNLGCVNAGVDVFLKDRTVTDMCRAARSVVMQVVGCHNMSNRFYTVHPRRNDRFLRASETLQYLYPEVDFTDYTFTKHLLGDLFAIDAQRFRLVVHELRMAWTTRMHTLISDIEVPVVLFWFADHHPRFDADDIDLTADPLFITQGMLDQLRPHVAEFVEICAPTPVPDTRTRELVFDPADAPAAAQMLGVGAHIESASRLSDALHRVLRSNQSGPVQPDRPASKLTSRA